MLKDKNIIVGVTGGIAAYKAVDVISRLKKLNANIDVIMTRSATKFVTPLTFQSISQNFVIVDMFNEPKKWEIEHISLAKKADLFLVVPATANIIGKIANGIADDMLSTTIMATRAKTVFVPSMNTNMYNNPIVKENIDKLKILGYEFIKPDKGRLACGDYGEGKMPSPESIVNHLVGYFSSGDLNGKKIIVTAGPTIEPLDPVRYFTNFSSGKMGYAIAEQSKKRGANVILVSGPTNINIPNGVAVKKVKTTREMLDAIKEDFDDCDALIKAAAPLDFRPAEVCKTKIKKTDEGLKIDMIRNPDIAQYFGSIKKNQVIIGFAAETDNIIENAKNKIAKKNLDMIVVNDVSLKDAGFNSETNIVTIIDKYGNITNYPKMTKIDVADTILNKLVDILNK